MVLLMCWFFFVPIPVTPRDHIEILNPTLTVLDTQVGLLLSYIPSSIVY
jgi:hypothetical protein